MNNDQPITAPKPVNPIDPLLATIATAVEEWRNDQDPEALKASVKRKLNESKDQIAMLLLGFEKDSFSRGKVYRIDQCNGREASTSVGQYLAGVQADAIKEWLAEAFEPPKLTAKQLQHLNAEANRVYEWKLAQKVRAFAEQKGDADATAIVDNIVKSNQLQDYLKLLKLVNPT